MHGVLTYGKTTLHTKCMEYPHMARQHFRHWMHGVSAHGKTTLHTKCTEYPHMARQHYTLNAWSINTWQDNSTHWMHGVSTLGKTTLNTECSEYQHMARQHYTLHMEYQHIDIPTLWDEMSDHYRDIVQVGNNSIVIDIRQIVVQLNRKAYGIISLHWVSSTLYIEIQQRFH